MNAKRFSCAGLTLLAGALLFVAAPTVSAAQQATDSRWLPWLGCWEPENATDGAMLCILPTSADAGVQMVSVEQGREVSRETISADGQQREAGRSGCTGTELARFSDDAQRIYLDATHTCEGGVRQQTMGLIALLSPTEWIDVRAVTVADNTATGVSRYRLAPSDVAAAAGFGDIAADRALAVRAARVQASARLGMEDVIDASHNSSGDVVRAWIAERREPFRLDAEQLLRLGDEGVTADVIDVVVAVSYPRRFTLDEGATASETELATRAPVVPYLGPRGRFFDPFYGYGYGYGYDRYLYDPYGYRTGYGYGGYGYGYGYPGTFRPTFVVIDTRQDPEPQGRVVNGRGYTRTTRAPASSGPATAPSSSSGSTTESSSSGEGSSGGSSSSGSGTSTGRTAQPRPPGQ